jgi:YD repeat-containing protein
LTGAPPGRVGQETDALGNEWQYGYYLDGSLKKTTDPDNRTITDDYDGAGNLTDTISANSGGSTTSAIHTDYNANEQPADTTDDSGETSYSYNPLGQLYQTSLPSGKTLTYGYNDFADTTSVAISGQPQPTQYQYNSDDQVTELIDPDGNLSQFSYTVDGQLAAVALPTDIAGTAYSYNYSGLVGSIASTNATGGTTSDLTYTYDPNGNTTNLTDAASGGETGAFGYDALNRLISESWTGNTNYNAGYTYDKAGNRTQAVINGAATSVSYNNDNELTSTSDVNGTTNYGYNNEGQPQGGSSHDYLSSS